MDQSFYQIRVLKEPCQSTIYLWLNQDKDKLRVGEEIQFDFGVQDNSTSTLDCYIEFGIYEPKFLRITAADERDCSRLPHCMVMLIRMLLMSRLSSVFS